VRRESEPSGPVFWIAAAVGLSLVAFGVAGLLRNLDGEALRSWATLFGGGLLVHDGIVAPAAGLLSLLLVRLLPRWARPTLTAGLIVSALVLVIALPLVYPDDTRLANNPSLLPGDYDRALIVVLALVWTVTLALLACARLTRSRRRR
jgi:hypothetical protein